MPSNSKRLNYISDKSGNMSLLAAGSLTAIMLAVGAAIDISDLASHKSSLQDATFCYKRQRVYFKLQSCFV